MLDADEVLTKEVKREIASALPGSKHQGYLLSYTNYFLGKKLKGGYPLRKNALFRVGEVEYERIEENNWSECDMEVHEHPMLTGTIGVIHSCIDHRDFRGISHTYINIMNTLHGRHIVFFTTEYKTNSTWKPHQRLKYRLLTSPGVAWHFSSGASLGWEVARWINGFAFCLLKASYFTQIACKLRELELKQRGLCSEILLYGLNYSPECVGIGKYSDELAQWLSAKGHEVCVITAQPYFPAWKLANGFQNRYKHET